MFRSSQNTKTGVSAAYCGMPVFLIVLMLLLAGCATDRYVSTGVPSRPSKPYVVQGKRYEPLADANGFVQRGLASHYGQDFHGRTTSSGETFNMWAMTAAHKTLPLGIFVKVRHRKSGREVTVRINDRGPFVADRIIDLSEGAADRLGMLAEGVAEVTVTALGYKVGDGYQQPADYDRGNYTLQVGAFTVRDNAYRYRDELNRKYGQADVQEAWVQGTRYYRVRLGRTTSLRTAQAMKEQYERRGISGAYVVAVD